MIMFVSMCARVCVCVFVFVCVGGGGRALMHSCSLSGMLLSYN